VECFAVGVRQFLVARRIGAGGQLVLGAQLRLEPGDVGRQRGIARVAGQQLVEERVPGVLGYLLG
jgi:hypothetical protein